MAENSHQRTNSEPTLNGPFNERIASRMRQLGMRKLEQFADTYGLGRTTVYSMVQGRVTPSGGWMKPSVDTLVKLAAALEVPVHVLLYELEPTAYGHEIMGQSEPIVRRLQVAVAGWLGAGPEQSEEIDDTILIDENFARGKDLVAYRIRGDSMAAGRHPIYDGDTVVVNRKDKGYNNAAVVARLVNGGHVCKLLKDDKYSDVVMLASANPERLNGTPLSVPPELVAEIIGRVVRVIHDEPSPESNTQNAQRSTAA